MAGLLGMAATAHGSVRIAEILADNASGLADADGDQSDWLELENAGAVPVSLDGWSLTDDPADLLKWRLPAVTLAAGARLVVFCSGKDRRAVPGELHASFSLDAAGEYLALMRPDGTAATEFAPAYPRQAPDISWGTARLVTADVLAAPTTPARWKVPAATDAGTAWQADGFDASGWRAVQAAVGWQVSASGPQPQAWWPFNGTANDAVAGLTAALNGPAWSTAAPPAGGGQSLAFSSVDGDHVTALLDVSETAYSASFWFRTASANAGLLSVADGDLGAGGHDRHVYLSAGNIRARTWNNETIGSSGRAFADGQWHHVAHVVGGTQGGQRLYVDGQQVAAGAKAQSDFNWQKRVHFGFSNDAASQYLNGDIDEVAFFAAALTASQVQSLAGGAPPPGLAGVSPWVLTDVGTGMRGAATGGWLRIPFTVPRDPAVYDELTLRVRHADGFVMWLNGTRILTRNAPADPAWDAAALTDRPIEEEIRQEIVDLRPWRHLLQAGGNVLAAQALTASPAAASFLFAGDLTAADVMEEGNRHMTTPTPGQPNATGFAGFVDDVTFSVKRGWFTAPFNVTVRCATPGAVLVRTTDGSAPSLTNGLAVPAADASTGPEFTLTVSTSTLLRVAAFRTGLIPAPPDTQTYLFASRVRTQGAAQAGLPATWAGGTPADYGVDANVVNSTLPGYSFEEALGALPTLSIAAAPADLFGAPSGVYYDTGQRGLASEKVVSVEFFDPRNEAEMWQAEAGLRSHGNSSRSHGFTPKHPLRLYFRRNYGDARLQARVFPDSPVREFNRLLLRGASTDSWPVVDGPPRWVNEKGTYIRDAWMRRAMRELGHPAGHSRYVQFFLNGLYWGLYEITERPEEDFAAACCGGDPDEYDVIKDFAELASGNMTAWNQLMAMADTVPSPLTTDVGYWQVQGLRPDGTPHPVTPPLLHMASFIDYMILHIAGGAEDWPNHNYWAFRRRGPASEGFRFIPWDQEISNDNTTRTGSHIFPNTFELVNAPNSPAILYDRLRQGPAFRQRFRDRVHALYFNGGLLTPPASRARWAALQGMIDKAIVGESARWGDARQTPAFRRETTWLAEMQFMQAPTTGFWDVMWPRQVQRFRNAGLYPTLTQPEFSRPSGPAAPGTSIGFTVPAGAVGWYTTDGSDPRGPDGRPSPTATAFDSGTTIAPLIPAGSSWRYLVTPAAPDAAWRGLAFDDGAWPAGAGQLGYGDGDEATVIGWGPSTTNRYITTYFRREFEVPAGDVTTALRLRLLRDDGAVVYLNGSEVARSNLHPTNPISWSTPALSSAGGADETSFYYEFTVPTSLIVPGRNVVAVEVHKVSAGDDDLSFDLALEATRQSAGAALVLNSTQTIRARALAGSEWSGLNSAFYQVDSVPATASNLVVSALHYQPAEPVRPEETAVSLNRDDYEYIELLNVSARTVDLEGVKFTEGIVFDFAASPVRRLLPGGRVLVVKNAAAFAARHGAGRPVAGEFTNGTGLANGGERLTLTGPEGVIRSFAYDDQLPWPAEADGSGPALVLALPGPGAASDAWHGDGRNWRVSTTAGGRPGEPDAETLAAWMAARGIADVSGDGDGDGAGAMLEYVLGGNPGMAEGLPLPTVRRRADGALILTIRRRLAAQVTWRVESSPDASSWSPSPVEVIGRIADGSMETMEVVPLPSPLLPTREFFRVVFSAE